MANKKGKTAGGKPIQSSSMHWILRDKTYIGITELKIKGTIAKGEHKDIISNELFNKVQEALKQNSSHRSKSRKLENLLTNKLFNQDWVLFKNHRANQTTKKLYYKIKGFYLPAIQLDNIVLQTIRDFLNSNMSKLPTDIAIILKHINFIEMVYSVKEQFIQIIIDKVIYSKDQIIFILNLNKKNLKTFVSEDYINQNSNSMKYIINDTTITITKEVYLRRYMRQTSKNIGNGAISITDNYNLILKTFASAWKYKKLYESGLGPDAICAQEHKSPRIIYNYLGLAYLNPKIIDKILGGKIQISVQDMFAKACVSNNFIEQEKIFE